MRECLSAERLPFAIGRKQYCAHRGGHAGAYGGYVGCDVLHRVIDAQPCMYRTAGCVEVDLYVLARISRVKIKQLSPILAT